MVVDADGKPAHLHVLLMCQSTEGRDDQHEAKAGAKNFSLHRNQAARSKPSDDAILG
jgi:hypothetical protein